MKRTDSTYKLKAIRELVIAYMNSGLTPDVFSREFYHAVIDLLRGKIARDLEVRHIDVEKIEEGLLEYAKHHRRKINRESG